MQTSANAKQAANNIRATAVGSMRTGRIYAPPAVATVRVIVAAPGMGSMPQWHGHPPLRAPSAAKRKRSAFAPQRVAVTKVIGPLAAAHALQAAEPRRRPAVARPGIKPVTVLLRKLPKGAAVRVHAAKLCAKLAGDTPFQLKVREALADINGGPAFLVYMRLEGQARGKHVITLYRNAYRDNG